MRGLVGYGVYVPYFRLDRKAIAAALRPPGAAGTRSVASYDDATTSPGAEAARAALRAAPVARADALFVATSLPAYLDKTNATAIHAALGLDAETLACDMLGSVRSGAGALRAALQGGGLTLVVHADIRTGLPGGGDERDGGDGAAALLGAYGPGARRRRGRPADRGRVARRRLRRHDLADDRGLARAPAEGEGRSDHGGRPGELPGLPDVERVPSARAPAAARPGAARGAAVAP